MIEISSNPRIWAEETPRGEWAVNAQFHGTNMHTTMIGLIFKNDKGGFGFAELNPRTTHFGTFDDVIAWLKRRRTHTPRPAYQLGQG